MAELCGNIKRIVTGSGTYSGSLKNKVHIQNVARQMAVTDARIRSDIWSSSVKCKFLCPVKKTSIAYLDREETEIINILRDTYEFRIKIRQEVTVKCLKILSVPLKKK
ncbi:MAG: hypothetical protein JNJ56_12215 [Ignavibacteria bacterium]|nr:hypothetical protein [Ignavibacteria bacterium]